MAISDLTDTSWELKSSLISYAGGSYSLKTYNVNITTESAIADSMGTYFDSFNSISIGYNNGSEHNEVYFNTSGSQYPCIVANGEDTKTLPDPWLNIHYSGPFTITGGTDATNANLIAWLEDNADLYVPPVDDVVISYQGTDIATMTANGTKTLLTQGTYCESNITVTYTKPIIPSAQGVSF